MAFCHTSTWIGHMKLYSLHQIFLILLLHFIWPSGGPRTYGVTGAPQSWLGHWILGDRSLCCMMEWQVGVRLHLWVWVPPPLRRAWELRSSLPSTLKGDPSVHKASCTEPNPGYKQTSQWKSSLFNKTSCRDFTSIFCCLLGKNVSSFFFFLFCKVFPSWLSLYLTWYTQIEIQPILCIQVEKNE